MNEVLFYLKRKMRKNITRNILSIASIALAIMIFVTTIICAASTKNYYNNYIGNRASGTDLIIELNGGENDLGLKNKLQNNKAIKSIISYSEMEKNVELKDKIATILLIGTNPKIEVNNGILSVVDGTLPEKNECMITESLRDDYKLSIGDSIKIQAGGGEKEYLISGILKNSGTVMKHSFSCIVIDQELNNVISTKEYRVNLFKKTQVEESIKNISSTIGSKYKIEESRYKSTSFDKELNIFFNLFYIVSAIIMILAYYLTWITIGFYIKKMRNDIAILKVLGTRKRNLFFIVSGIGVFITLIGVLSGIFFGIISSKIILNIIGGLLKVDKIPYLFPYIGIFWGSVIVVFIGFITSIMLGKKYLNESIADGLNERETISTKKVSDKKIYFLIIGFVLGMNLIFNHLPFKPYEIILRIVSVVLLVISITKIFLEIFIKRIIGNKYFIDNCNGLLIKNNFSNNKNRVQKVVILTTLIVTLALGMAATGNQFNKLIDNLLNYSYFGDVVLNANSDSTVTNMNLENTRKTNMVEEVYPLYQRYIDYKGMEIQVNGYVIDDRMESQLKRYLNLNNEDLKNVKNTNTLLASELVLQKNGLKIGDTIKIGKKDFEIKGSYKSVINDGKSLILSKEGFLSADERYKIRSANIILKKGKTFENFINSFQQIDKDSNISIRSVNQAKTYEEKIDKQFMYILDSVVIFILLSGILIIVNSIISEIKENNYTMTILKRLGFTKRQIKSNYIFDILIKSIFSCTLAVLSSIFLNWIFIDGINSTLHWGLLFKIDYKFLIISWTVLIILNLAIESLIVKKMYGKF